MKVDAKAEHNYLNCVFYSGDRARKFDIVVDGTVLDGPYAFADAPSENAFFTHTVEIPKEMIANAKEGKVTVKFQSKPEYNSMVGGLFGISTSTSAEYDKEASLKALSFNIGKLTEEFTPEMTTYVLEVPMDTERVEMLATPKMESGLVYVDNILIDDKHVRMIPLTGEETVVSILTKAQDHVTEKEYQVTIKKVEDEVPALDKSALQKKIEDAKAIGAEGYTTESYQALQDAIAVAEKAMNTVETEQDVKDAVEALQKAIDSLVPEQNKPGENPGTPETPDDTGNNGTPENPMKPEAVKTGDTANMSIIFFLIGSAGIAAMLIRRRRF